MPSKVSDIHEISVIVGFLNEGVLNRNTHEKFITFSETIQKFGNDRMNISKNDFRRYEELFNRGIRLSKILKDKHNLQGKDIRWAGAENHKEDSSDIYVDQIGISLKDSSKIIRNSGFEQFMDTFCKNPIKKFKEPFWELAPKLSMSYLMTVFRDCYKRGFLRISNRTIVIDGKASAPFEGSISDLGDMSLDKLLRVLKKTDIKKLVKDFSGNGDLKKLIEIRKSLVKEVSKKIMANLAEGLIQDPNHFSEKIKYILQYREKEKLFGFSSSKEMFTGVIVPKAEVFIRGEKVFTEPSQLTEKTMGLQINMYTDISIKIFGRKKNVQLQNQIRYKHRTFSCAPEANFHLLNYSDWQILYPPQGGHWRH